MIRIKRNLVFLLILISLQSIHYNVQGEKWKLFSSFRESIDSNLNAFLLKNEFGKMTCYYDEVEKQSGKWEYYPYIRLSNDYFVVQISSFKIQDGSYNYLIFINKLNLVVTDTIGPFYDSWADAITMRLNNNKIEEVTIRFVNPPEPSESKYTIIKYKREKSILVQKSRRNKN